MLISFWLGRPLALGYFWLRRPLALGYFSRYPVMTVQEHNKSEMVDNEVIECWMEEAHTVDSTDWRSNWGALQGYAHHNNLLVGVMIFNKQNSWSIGPISRCPRRFDLFKHIQLNFQCPQRFDLTRLHGTRNFFQSTYIYTVLCTVLDFVHTNNVRIVCSQM